MTRLFLRFSAALLTAAVAPAADAVAVPGDDCVPVGQWVVPATGETVPYQAFVDGLARRAVVLLGEAHDRTDHHRWQLHTIAALRAHHSDLVLGFEAFPRRVQPVLDRWVKGELSESAFLAETDWRRVWGVDAALYLPLFHYARINRVPMIALNVEQSLSARVRDEGWSAVATAEREGVGDPALASPADLDSLAEVFREHPQYQREHGAAEDAFDYDDPAFRRFVEAQLLWDRAMAEAIHRARQAERRPLVVGVLGAGHVQDRFGVPHQLDALGVTDVAVLLPWDHGQDCGALNVGLADAVFGLDPTPVTAPPKPRLGIRISSSEGGVRVVEVMQDSVAAAARIEQEDVIYEAAGIAVAAPADLIAVVQRQAPGTWLPLKVRRAGASLEIIAKFPSET
jgi:uncharacterized iron-regulated protein